MNIASLKELAFIVTPLILASVTAFFSLKKEKPKTDADIRKIDAENSITFGEEWRKLYSEIRQELQQAKITIEEIQKKYVAQSEQKDKLLEDMRFKLDFVNDNLNTLVNSNTELREQLSVLKLELESIRIENKNLKEENSSKVGRISILESQIVDLQTQLNAYGHVENDRIDGAKESLHTSVEIKLNNLKK